MRVTQPEICKEPLERGSEASDVRELQLLAGNVAGGERVDPPGVKLIPGGEVMVHSNQILVRLVMLNLRRHRGAGGNRGGNPPAGTIRSGKILKESGRNAVRLRGDDRLPVGRVLGGDHHRLTILQSRPLVVQKEKGIVSNDGTTQRSTELVLLERCLLHGVKKVPSVQGGIPAAVKSVSVKIIRPRFGDHIHNRTVVPSVLCREIEYLNLNLLNRIQRGVNEGGSPQPLIVVGISIENKVVLSRSRSVCDVTEIKGDRGGRRRDI